MKILIVSDTHRREDSYYKVVQREAPIDLLLHCGDAEGSELKICEAVQCPAEIVLGNNDFFSDLPREREFQLGKYNLWLTHGHNYFVSMDSEKLKQEARSRGANIVVFGHTHKPVIEKEKDIIAVNPGSLTYPRQEGKKPSYIIMEIDDTGEATFEIRYL